MNVVRGDHIIEHGQTETFFRLEQPVQVAAPILVPKVRLLFLKRLERSEAVERLERLERASESSCLLAASIFLRRPFSRSKSGF